VQRSVTLVRPPFAASDLATNPIPALAARVVAILNAYRENESALCSAVAVALAQAIGDAGWIPQALRVPAPTTYRRELLHEAGDGSFSIGCFVWGPGQRTPIHDHRCWGVIGGAVGMLEAVSFIPRAGGFVLAPVERIRQGTCAWLHPADGDIHQVGAAEATTAVSIHVYGARLDTVCWRRYNPDGTVLPG
jgi:3-mercaptopropionate dioxygenase